MPMRDAPIIARAVHAVIFDMDGLLFDTERLYIDAMTHCASELGAILPQEVAHLAIGLPRAASRDVWSHHFGPDFNVGGFTAAAAGRFADLAGRQLGVKAGVIELLDLLDRWRLPRAIATSTARDMVVRHLDHSGLADRFDAIIADGDYALGKPHPDPYLAAAERLGVASGNCLALEDSHNGVRSAAAAGMMTIMVPDLLAATDEMRELTLAVAQDLHVVRGWLERAGTDQGKQGI